MKKIYLASTSPRRKELLKHLVGDNFSIVKSDYEEDNTLDMPHEELAVHHAVGKGEEAAKHLDEGIVISADSFVSFQGEFLGKQDTNHQAKETLRKLSGKCMDVITGYFLKDLSTGKIVKGFESAKVHFGELSEELIDRYVDAGEARGKAGAYDIEGKGVMFVEKIEGDFYSIRGLPLYKIAKGLKEMGVDILEYD